MEIADLSWNEVTIKRFNHPLLPRSIRGIIVGKSGCGKMMLLLNLLLRLGWLDYNNLCIFGKSLFQPEDRILKKASKENLPKECILRLFNMRDEIQNSQKRQIKLAFSLLFCLSKSKSSKIIKFLSLEFRSSGSGMSLAVSKKLHFTFDSFLIDLAHSYTTIDGGIWLFCAAKQIASSTLDVGKSVAKEGAKKALEVGKSAAVEAGKKLVTKALTPKSKKILQKYTEPKTRDINALIDGSAIAIQDLVKKLNSGAGIKVV